MWLVLGLGFLNAIYFPGIRTSVCAIVGPENYGKALGAVACCQQIVAVFAAPVFFSLQGRTSEGCTGRGVFSTCVVPPHPFLLRAHVSRSTRLLLHQPPWDLVHVRRRRVRVSPSLPSSSLAVIPYFRPPP